VNSDDHLFLGAELVFKRSKRNDNFQNLWRNQGGRVWHRIDWGNVPSESVATLYLPGIDTNDIMLLAARKYRSHRLVRIDEHTLKMGTGGITYLPIPFTGGSFPGMLTVDLSEGIEKGQAFTVVVRQVTGEAHSVVVTHHTEEPRPSSKHIIGSFQLTIPVSDKADILPRQERLLSNLRWIERAIPTNDRWSPVFSRYVMQIAGRVDALGGNSNRVPPSATGEWQKAYRICLILTIAAVLLITTLVVGVGALQGGLMVGTGILILAMLLSIVYFWINKCRPKMCQLLSALLAGSGIGAIILAILAVFGISTPLLITILLVSASVTAVTAVVSWMKGCLRW